MAQLSEYEYVEGVTTPLLPFLTQECINLADMIREAVMKTKPAPSYYLIRACKSVKKVISSRTLEMVLGDQTARGAGINGAVHTHRVGDEQGKAESKRTEGLNRDGGMRGQLALKWGKVLHLSASTVFL